MSDPVILGLIRFSSISRHGLGHWRLTLGCTLKEAAERVFDPVRMDARFRMFESVTLPSLDAQQTQVPFRVLVVTSTLMPQPMWARLVRMTSGRRYIRLRRMRPIRRLRMVAREELALFRKDPDAVAATFRLDDDDALGAHFVEDLSQLATTENAGTAVTFKNGVYLGRSGDGFALDEHSYPLIGCGLALIAGAGDGRTILDAGLHATVNKRFPLLVESRPHSWIRSIHDRSDSGTPGVPRPRRGPVSVAQARAELQEAFPTIDFAAVHAAYSTAAGMERQPT